MVNISCSPSWQLHYTGHDITRTLTSDLRIRVSWDTHSFFSQNFWPSEVGWNSIPGKKTAWSDLHPNPLNKKHWTLFQSAKQLHQVILKPFNGYTDTENSIQNNAVRPLRWNWWYWMEVTEECLLCTVLVQWTFMSGSFKLLQGFKIYSAHIKHIHVTFTSQHYFDLGLIEARKTNSIKSKTES